jgi:hypothetical protein
MRAVALAFRSEPTSTFLTPSARARTQHAEPFGEGKTKREPAGKALSDAGESE